jgi:predicted RNA binding protein YcfA (HicA-like mRNA interferase family)
LTVSSLPQVNGANTIRALQKTGFVLRRQKGSHAILIHSYELLKFQGSKKIFFRFFLDLIKKLAKTSKSLKLIKTD